MKKLILKDHLNQKLVDFDLFVEGQDFSHTFPEPKAFWLGTIMVVDTELDSETVEEADVKLYGENYNQPKPEVESGPVLVHSIPMELEPPDICRGCKTWEDCQGSNIEDCQRRIEEAINEPEKIYNQSNGDSRLDTASEPESVTKLLEKPAGRKPAKGSKKPRKPKTT